MISADAITDRLEAVTSAVRNNFLGMDKSRFATPPAKGKWSAADCLLHIVRTNEAYFPIILRASSPEYRSTFWENISPFSKSTGAGMILSLGPDSPRRYKAPKLFDPTAVERVDEPLVLFFDHQEKLKTSLGLLTETSIRNRVISSPVSNLITFRAIDLAVMLVAHEERHLKQAIAACKIEQHL